MKVRDLLESIKDLDPDMEVIIQKDAEGNDYSPLSGVDSDCIYVPDCNWSGQVYDVNWSADDADMEEDEWEEIKLMPLALVLAPIN